MRSLACACWVLACSAAAVAGWDGAYIEGRTAQNKCFYAPNEKMTFELTLRGHELPAGDWFIRWKRSGDDGQVEEGRSPIPKVGPLLVETSLGKPGFIRLEAFVTDRDGRDVVAPANPHGKVFFDGGAGVEPEKLVAPPDPDGFDAWWRRHLGALPSVPMNPRLKEFPSGRADVKLYEFALDCPGGKPSTGWMAIPVAPGKYPIRVKFFGYNESWSPRATAVRTPKEMSEKELRVWISPHGFEQAREPDYYAKLRKEVGAGYDGHAWSPVENANPDTSYFAKMAWRIFRALGYAKTRPEWDQKTLIVTGGSQGALQSVWAAAFDPAVTDADISIVWNCDAWGKEKEGRLAGDWMLPWAEGLRWFDAVTHAKRIPARCRVDISYAGLGDYISPPSGLAAFYNSLQCRKSIKWVQGGEHGNAPMWKNWQTQSFSEVPRVGFPRADAAERIREEFKTPPPGYGEVPFWWWTGDKLNKQRLLEQIEALHQAGVSGMQVNYSHTRSDGWRTADVEPAIFSDEWWEIFNFVAEESAKRGMGIGLSGYTIDWPGNDNLFAKLGISAKDTRAHQLSMRTLPSSSGHVGPFTDSGLVSVSAFRKGEKGTVPVLLPTQGGDLPDGDWEIRVVTAHPVDKTLDPLNPASARRLIDHFLTPFERRLSPLGRKALNYFFQDELRLGGDLRLWSQDFASEFQNRKGYDILPWVSGLCADVGEMTAKVRLDANDVMVQLTEERYFKPIYDWHASRGLIYACDPASRGRNPMEFGDYMRSMRWYTAPGFDTPGTSADVIKNKVGSSIAHLYRRPRVWLEGYHSQGWQASTTTIFDSSVHNFVYGSSLLNLHGLYYSTFGGWWEWAPPCYHFRMPYWRHMPTYLKYFERLSYVLSQGDHVADVAVVNPLEPLVVDRGRGTSSVKLAHEIVSELVTKRGVDVDFIDGDSILNSKFENGRLCIAGEQYRLIVLPDMFALRSDVLANLVAFTKVGGVVAVFGRSPELSDIPGQGHLVLVKELECTTFPAQPSQADYAKLISLIGQRDFVGSEGTKVLHRRIGNHDLYFLVDLPNCAECEFRAQGTPEIWDPWTGDVKTVNTWSVTEKGTTKASFASSGQPVLLAFDRSRKECPPSITSKDQRPIAKDRLLLDGLWKFTLLPTLDNKWGDYRLPATAECIGAEIRRFKSDVPGREGESTVGFGPQFRNLATGEFHDFSWRWGEEFHPAYQDWHHGLNRKVGDDFFTFGPYDNWYYDVKPKPDAVPKTETYETFVYVPTACPVRIETHGVSPREIKLAEKACSTNAVIELSAGYHPLRVTYEAFGRAAIVVRRMDLAAKPSEVPLSMRWYDDPSILRFDPFAGRIKQTTFTASVPPGFEAARISLDGELIAARCDDTELKVSREGDSWAVKATTPFPRGGRLALYVRPSPGAVGCGVFREPVKLSCVPGEILLGDWASFDGLRCYSGGAVYERTFELTADQTSRAISLNLGAVAATCDVSVNGSEPQVLCAPPWTVSVTGKVHAGTNTVRVTVFNTLNNHYQTIPTRYKKPVEQVPSGLLGPVVLEFE